jgi:hypothetical protein
MDAIIDENDSFVILPDIDKIVITIVGYNNQMQRITGIRHSHFKHFHFGRLYIELLPPINGFKISGSFCALAFFKYCCDILCSKKING